MQITRNSLDTGRGPTDWFTGAVYVDTVAAPSNAHGSARAACVEVDEDGRPAVWGEHVSDDEYAAAPATGS